ncbi:MAG: NAD(P)H-binding protein [Bryobacterales bacterium]|nr:NAD(P)H-binding protein [Bryobacterales bacterium]
MRFFVLGVSGGVESQLLGQAAVHGHQITAQTRSAGRAAETEKVRAIVGSPADERFLRDHLAGHEAVVDCTGIDHIGKTKLFFESNRAVLVAMRETGVRRLVAITGIGASISLHFACVE